MDERIDVNEVAGDVCGGLGCNGMDDGVTHDDGEMI